MRIMYETLKNLATVAAAWYLERVKHSRDFWQSLLGLDICEKHDAHPFYADVRSCHQDGYISVFDDEDRVT